MAQLFMVVTVCLLMNLFTAESIPAAEAPSADLLHHFDSLNTKMRRTGLTLHLTYTGEAKHGFGTIPDDMTQYRGLFELTFRGIAYLSRTGLGFDDFRPGCRAGSSEGRHL